MKKTISIGKKNVKPQFNPSLYRGKMKEKSLSYKLIYLLSIILKNYKNI